MDDDANDILCCSVCHMYKRKAIYSIYLEDCNK